jgi:hypothetical protein
VSETLDEGVYTAIKTQQHPLAPRINAYAHKMKLLGGAEPEKAAVQYPQRKKYAKAQSQPDNQNQGCCSLVVEYCRKKHLTAH